MGRKSTRYLAFILLCSAVLFVIILNLTPGYFYLECSGSINYGAVPRTLVSCGFPGEPETPSFLKRTIVYFLQKLDYHFYCCY